MQVQQAAQMHYSISCRQLNTVQCGHIPRAWRSCARQPRTALAPHACTALKPSTDDVLGQASSKPSPQPLLAALAAGACSLLLSCADPQPAVSSPVLPASEATPHAAPAVAAARSSTLALQQTTLGPAQGHAARAPALASSIRLTSPADLQQPSQAAVLPLQIQQQQAQVQELAQLAALWDTPKMHWLAVVLGVGVVNILGLQAVLKLLQASQDSSTPVTLLVCRAGLRLDSERGGGQLQERLHYLRGLMPVEQMGMFFTFEEAMRTICQPPRGSQLAYADLAALPLGSKQAGYDRFKQAAAREAARAEQEEAQQVLQGVRPEGPQHRNMLQKLLGAAETQDAEESQACLLVNFIVLAKGTFQLPEQPLRDARAFRETMKSLAGHLSAGQLLAIEMLITPDSAEDFLSEAQLIASYPSLTDLASGLRVDHPRWSPAPSPLASADEEPTAAAATTPQAADVAGGAAAAAAGAEMGATQ